MRSSKGFTLIELMVAVALLAVIVSLAAPAMGDFLVRQRVVSQASELTLAMALARSEAVKSNARVVVLPATASSTGWSDGWCVGPASIANCSESAVIRHFSAKSGVNITSSNLASPHRIIFLRDGTRGFGSGIPSLKVSSPQLKATATDARCITLNPQGRAAVQNIDKDSACPAS